MESKKRAKFIYLVLTLTICNLVVTAVLGGMVYQSSIELRQTEATKQEKYVLYIGMNDKETYTQKIPTDKARQIVNEICMKHVEGYAVSEAQGGWTDEKGEATQENTLIYTFNSVEQEQVNKIMDEVLTALNQNAILVEKQELSYTYYNGTES